jgi:hypothetical protein
MPSAAMPQHQNPVCARLESQLAMVERGGSDPGRAEQIRRYEDAANKQQFELDRLTSQARRSGCDQGFFLFQSPQCSALNNQIQQMRSNLDRMQTDLQRLQAPSPERESQRRTVLAALSQSDCGPQYRAAAVQPRPQQQAPRGFFEQLFGGFRAGEETPPDGSIYSPEQLPPGGGGGYRTVCVRTCDGFYFPISFSTNPSRFGDDERACQRMCPAAEVALYSYRNPGEDMSRAVSVSGQPYTALPNAFRYRQKFSEECSCKRSGETWAQALKHLDERSTLERGDIMVTEERSRQMSQPRVDAQGRPIRPEPQRAGAPGARGGATTTQPAAAGAAPTESAEPAKPEPPKGPVRSVGPVFIPSR